MRAAGVPVVNVVDDDPVYRKALARLIRANGHEVATFRCATEFLALRAYGRPGCLVTEVLLSDMSGLDLFALLRSPEYTPPVVFVTGVGDIPMAVRAMKGGAIDFLTKPVDEAELLAAVARGIAWDEAARRERSQLGDLRDHFARLTPREREVFTIVVQGLPNKQIAARLGTSEQTVKVHRGRIMKKMEAGSLAQLVIFSECLAHVPAWQADEPAPLGNGPSPGAPRSGLVGARRAVMSS